MAAEGFADTVHGRTWFRLAGTVRPHGPAPLVVVHGGPGATHDYLLPLADLADGERAVVFYDQLGNGRSAQLPEHAEDPTFWTVDRFVDQLAQLVDELHLPSFHLLGHSWGGFVAQEFALTHPAGLRSLVLASSAADLHACVEAAQRLRETLPGDVRRTLHAHEEAGTTGSAAYQQACSVYYRRHFCRIDPWPQPLLRTFQALAEHPEVFATVYGPSPFTLTGSARDWYSTPRLKDIAVPSLVLSGRHDQATPALQEPLTQQIPQTHQVIFEDSSHTAFWEERPRFISLVRDWLQQHDP